MTSVRPIRSGQAHDSATGEEPPPSVAKIIRQAVAKCMDEEKARQLIHKLKPPLDFDQWDAILTSLARVAALLRLVGNNAWFGQNGTAFNRDVHATMELALEELDHVTVPLRRMDPDKTGNRKELATMDKIHGNQPLIRAAQYIRTATEPQQDSMEYQSDIIREFASKNGMEVVRTYTDSGKGGMTLEGRAGLQQMLKDVTSGTADYEVILMVDISRWGRFQDADQSAYCEYICKRHKIRVEYCADTSINPGSQTVVQKRLYINMIACNERFFWHYNLKIFFRFR